MQIIETVRDIQKFIDENNEWSIETFGEGGPVPPLEHLADEVQETIQAVRVWELNYKNPDLDGPLRSEAITEFADCFILLCQAAKKFNVSFSTLLYAAQKKMKVNESRKWAKSDGKGRSKHIEPSRSENDEHRIRVEAILKQ